MVFTNAEIEEFNNIMQSAEQNISRGKKPQVSSVLMGLQFAAVIPGKTGRMWFEDSLGRLMMVSSIRKLMDDNTPDMFSVVEKAFMFSILHIGSLCEAVDRAGMELKGSTPPNPVEEEEEDEEESWKPQQDESGWSEQD